MLVDTADAALTLVLRHLCDIGSAHDDGAGIHRNAAADQIQHGCFAGSVAADNGNKLAVIDAEVEIVKEAHFIYSACVVIFTDVF